ncbi:MAG: hypothetical protein ACKPBU_15720, partial [Alphaproteobacteria bacterium]
MDDEHTWRRCSTCKAPIGFGAVHWTCSVTTCNRPRATLAFCSVECWDAHVPVVRHRDAWAEEGRSPTREAALAEAREEREKKEARDARPAPVATTGGIVPRKTLTRAAGGPRPALFDERRRNDAMSDDSKEVLVVVSKLKAYIR